MARYTLEDGQYKEDWSDKIEPWTAGLGLTADAVGLGTAATGIGAPIGGTIALIGNIPNFIIDAKKRMKEKQINQERMIGHILSGIQNSHNVIAALPNDATRVNRPIYIPQLIQLR